MNNHYSDKERLELIARRTNESGVDLTADQRQWTIVAYACASLGEDGREAFHLFSSLHPKYSREECDRHFTYCLRTRRNQVSPGTLYKLCQDAGIDTAMPRGRRKKAAKESADEQRNLITVIKEQLSANHQWRKNILSDKVEHSEDGLLWSEVDDRYVNTIATRLREEGLRVKDNELRALIDSSDFSCDYRPELAYLESLKPWNPDTDPDHIHDMFVGHMEFDNETDIPFYDRMFRRWFVAIVALWLGRIEENPIMPTFCGKQHIGKTFFCKNILPPCLRKYIAMIRPNDPIDKDTMLTLSEVLLIVFDELRINSDSKSNMMKFLITSGQTNLRSSYDRYRKARRRLASLIATTNYREFIHEAEGNRRYVGIDLKATVNLTQHPINHDGAYAQALYLLDHGFSPKPTYEESQLISEHNRAYMETNDCEEALRTFVRQPGANDTAEWLTAGNLMQELTNRGFRFSSVEIGRAMTRMGFEKRKNRGYLLVIADYDRQKRERQNWNTDNAEAPVSTTPADEGQLPF